MSSALDARTTELVGVAAAVAGHCQPCFDHHYHKAIEVGATLEEIRAAVALARAVRAAGDRHMDEHVARGMADEMAPPVPGGTR
jgi:AhpD family alkylhydroperoxidase